MAMHRADGAVLDLPLGQERPDTKATLERDGLITCQYDEQGKYIGTDLLDPLNIRVICWQLNVNGQAKNRKSAFRRATETVDSR